MSRPGHPRAVVQDVVAKLVGQTGQTALKPEPCVQHDAVGLPVGTHSARGQRQAHTDLVEVVGGLVREGLVSLKFLTISLRRDASGHA